MGEKTNEINGIQIDRPTVAVFGLAIANIVAELLARRYLPDSWGVTALETSQIFIFFSVPLVIILKNFRRAILLTTLFALIYLLFSGSIFLLVFFWLLFASTLYYHRQECSKFGLQSQKVLVNLALGVLVAGIVIAHMTATIYLAHWETPFTVNPGELFQKILPELAFGVIAMELFFRGMLFKRLREKNNFSFVWAGIISTALYLLPFLTNPLYFTSPGLIASVIYYIILEGFLFCYLVERTKSLIPSTVASIAMLVFINIVL